MDHFQDSQGSAPHHAPTRPAEDPGLVVCSQASHHQQVHQGQLPTGVPTGPVVSSPSVPTYSFTPQKPQMQHQPSGVLCSHTCAIMQAVDVRQIWLCLVQGKAEQRLLVQQTIDANGLGLLRLLGEHVKLSCSNCFLHSIVADAPFELLVVLMKAAGGLDTAHPELKSPLIHKVFTTS